MREHELLTDELLEHRGREYIRLKTVDWIRRLHNPGCLPASILPHFSDWLEGQTRLSRKGGTV